MAPKGYILRDWRLLRDDLKLQSFRGERVFSMKVEFGAVWSDSGRTWSGGGLWMDREMQTSQWEAFSCMDTCHHLNEGHFLPLH